jgi:hypothetical protein
VAEAADLMWNPKRGLWEEKNRSGPVCQVGLRNRALSGQ